MLTEERYALSTIHATRAIPRIKSCGAWTRSSMPSHDWFELASMPAAATLDDSVPFFLNRTQATVQCDSVNCEAELTETLETDTRYTRFILTLLRSMIIAELTPC
jgi:hypothetical protein